MNCKQKQIVILIFLVFLIFTINYSFFDSILINFFDETETVVVERVIDGDTIVIDTASLRSRHENLSRGKTSVRLLGINSPERGELYYNEAKEFLEGLVLNEKVKLEFGKEKYDKYNRMLAYVFIGDKNVNLGLVEEGFANFYFYEKDKYYNDFKNAWQDCIESNKNLCEKSQNKCADCMELQEFDYKNEIVVFYNKCDFDCDLTDWEIKDEGRKKFVFNEFVLEKNSEVRVIVSKEDKVNNLEEVFWIRNDYVWTDSGDTLFLRDEKGELVLWRSY